MMRAEDVKLGVVTDKIYHTHDTGSWHPESPQRLVAVEEAIEGLSDEIIKIQPREASHEDLLLVHGPEYVDRIFGIEKDEIVMLDPDTAFSPRTKKASLMAVGGVLEAADGTLRSDRTEL